MTATTCPACAVTYITAAYSECPLCLHAYEVKRALLAFSGRPAVKRSAAVMLPRSKAWAYGAGLPQSKLTAATVRQARIDYAAAQAEIKRLRSDSSIEAFARRAGVSPGAMYKAIKGISWARVVA